jgi:hypothetical protein
MADEAAMARAELLRKAQQREDVVLHEKSAHTSAQVLMDAAVSQRPLPGATSAPGSELASATAIPGGGRWHTRAAAGECRAGSLRTGAASKTHENSTSGFKTPSSF